MFVALVIFGDNEGGSFLTELLLMLELMTVTNIFKHSVWVSLDATWELCQGKPMEVWSFTKNVRVETNFELYSSEHRFPEDKRTISQHYKKHAQMLFFSLVFGFFNLK